MLKIIILNEPLTQPLKFLKSEMSIEDFTELWQEALDNGGTLEWSFNYNNPEWSPEKEKPFLNFVKGLDPYEGASQVKFQSIYPVFGDVLVFLKQETKTVELHIVYGVDDFWELEVCQDCFIALFGCDEEAKQEEHISNFLTAYPILQHDQSRDDEFLRVTCYCCGSKLGGKRYFLIGMKED